MNAIGSSPLTPKQMDLLGEFLISNEEVLKKHRWVSHEDLKCFYAYMGKMYACGRVTPMNVMQADALANCLRAVDLWQDKVQHTESRARLGS